MGRRPKIDLDLGPTLEAERKHDELILAIYSAFTKACKSVDDYFDNRLNSKTCLEVDGSSFLQNGIILASSFAKQISLFTSLDCHIQHEQIKAAVIETYILAEAVRVQHEDFEDISIHSRQTDSSLVLDLRESGKILRDKILALHLSKAEISLLLSLILFCSDRQYQGCSDRQKLEYMEESVLSALMFKLMLNHSRQRNILPQIIEIICCLRGLTSLYLEKLLGLKT